jgi:hypothetical protein
MQFYQHSGRSGTLGVPLAAAAGLFAGLVLAFCYAYVINWIPFIYVSFIATIAFGFCVGAAASWGAQVGKMRNLAFTKMTAGLVAVIALYFAWAFDPMARFEEIGEPFWDLQSIWEYMQLGYQQGFWTIGRAGPNGNAVSGMFLAAVWIVEAALIIGCAVTAPTVLLGERPFCEETAQWTTKQTDVASLSLMNDAEVDDKLKRLMAGDLDALALFYRSDGTDPATLKLDLSTCPDCPTCNFLTVRSVHQVVDKKGKTSKQEQKLLVNLQVAPESVDMIRHAGADRPSEPAADPQDVSGETA